MPYFYINFVITLLCVFDFAIAFNTLVSVIVKLLLKFECANKPLLKESCVQNFRNRHFAKLLLFEILGHFQKLFWAKILGFRIFRVVEILGNLLYIMVVGNKVRNNYKVFYFCFLARSAHGELL